MNSFNGGRVDLIAERLKRYSGLIKLVTLLIAFILLIVGGGAYINENIVQRETFARAKTLNYLDMLLRFGSEDQQLRQDIHTHLLMFRDGGRLATPFGPAWDYPPVQSQGFQSILLDIIGDYEQAQTSGNWAGFVEDYVEFDTAYGELIQGRQRVFVGVQYAAAGVVLLGFFGILALLFFRLGKADDEALAVRRENDHILASTKEGVFLIDSDYTIGAQQSGAVQELFGRNISVQGNFLDFVRELVPKDDYERVKKFLGLVFGGRVKPRLMGDLNPLQNVELSAERKIGGAVRRILNFDFSRDEQSDDVEKLLVTVSDTTKEALLREELETTQKIQDEKLSLLKGILHVEPALLSEFIVKGKSSFSKINDLLEQSSDYPDQSLELLEEISRSAHRLKGDASALRLELFESSLHRFEDTIDELRNKNLVDGQSLLKLVVELKNMIAELDLADSLTNQYSLKALSDHDGRAAQAEAESSGDEPVLTEKLSIAETFQRKLKSLVDEVSGRQNKRVNFSVSGADHLNDHPRIASTLTDIAVQLTRNAIVHGIEPPENRTALGKPAFGKLHTSLSIVKGQLMMEVEDDGQGLNYERIKQVAIERGLINPAAQETVDSKRLLQILFSHGFSSSESVDEDSGRGVGLDAVKSMVYELNGQVRAGSVSGKQTRFTIMVPIANEGGL